MAAAPARARAAVGSHRSSASTKLSQDAPQAAGASGNPHGGRTRRAATAHQPSTGDGSLPYRGARPQVQPPGTGTGHAKPPSARRGCPSIPFVGVQLPSARTQLQGRELWGWPLLWGELWGRGGQAGTDPAPTREGLNPRGVLCRKPDSQLSWQRASPGLLSK